MNRFITVLALLCFAVPASAQVAPTPSEDAYRIDGVLHIAKYRDGVIVLARDANAARGFALHVIDAPVTDFAPVGPDSIVYVAGSTELPGPSQVLWAVFTSPEGIRLVITTPCKRYTSFKACNKKHKEAVMALLEEWGIDKEASSKGDIVLPQPNDKAPSAAGSLFGGK